MPQSPASATHNGQPAINAVLATVPYQPDELALLRAQVAPAQFIHCSSTDEKGIADALKFVDVAIISGDLDDRYLEAPALKWVHCDHSGLTRSARPEVFQKGLLVTGSAGRSAAALAQHAFYFALALTYDARQLMEKQAAHAWRGIPGYEQKLGLAGKTLGIIGYGQTGAEMAALGKAFQMRVIALNRSAIAAPVNVDLMLSSERGDTIDPLIEQADVIMLATQLTDVTYHMFSAPQFARMKPSAFIINMARGQVIDEQALVQALRSGEIAGAGLDVFAKEPLPADSPLWDLSNVLVTPHMTPGLPDKRQRSIQMITENIARYREGRPMLNALSEKDVFTPKS
ncbi:MULTISPECIES: D-2-hydroxyacid dehydrogenase [Rhizobium]|uniref:D-2-hydroxyacid dehydrogenase n=1 Tax=Rhizobium TaxID=379 RepID=UPI0007E94F99|nr:MULTISPECIES: D-2-hydroxyacid dehydrogenase [Rhizobium]ANK95481.1 D-2-hydroxyacid dehydrogenase protein [Rhizobium sp. N6212]ANL01533.1 D-2-hydroxyacid dehydrogenase protein [Rhizobium sp. N621]ANL07661.1 D-2-hydroxyacid dehydrogenase protein [Rhizobium esperanzae]ANL13831.1 D-2-hydroxyacid dehydrogenase protein [Rhizobium sp. N1341]ANL25818.1 D-2-hydroxyacid dehydrogenase protein [Rhizobium sp. N113]